MGSIIDRVVVSSWATALGESLLELEFGIG
jgi:hypothetical protein